MRGTRTWIAMVAAGLLALAAVTVGRAGAVLNSSSGNASNSYTVAPDFVAPTANRAAVAASPGTATYVAEVLADSPLGYWRLGEASGPTATDSSGNGRNGTYAGTYTLAQAGALNSMNTAAYFGIGSADISSTTLQPSSAVTVEAWVKPTATCGNCAVFDKSRSGGTNSSFLMWVANGQVKCRFIKGGAQYNVLSNGTIPDNVWSHLACTWDGTTIRMYVNAAQQTDTTTLTPPLDTGTGWSRIGRLADGTYSMYGTIDEVAVYGSGLSAARIAAHYQAAFGPSPDGARACRFYYAFADVTDTGNPASGVASVTGNLSSLTAGAGAASLLAGSYSLNGSSYGYRSRPLLATAAPGSYTFAVTSLDNAANSRVQTGFPATVAANTQAVAAVFLTGLEQGVASSTSPGVFDTVTGVGVSADGVTKRNGSYSLRVAPANAAAYATATLSGSGAVGVVRFAVRLASLPAATVNLFAVIAGAGNSAYLVYDIASGRFGVRWGTAAVTTGSVSPVADAWYVIEIQADVAANPRTLAWRIDGVDQTAASSPEAASTVSSVQLGTSATNITYTANFDDIIASRTAADYPIGNGKVLSLAPSGMGTHVNPTNFREDDGTAIDANTWNRVDEVPASSTADYIRQSTSGGTSYIEVTFADTTETCINAVGALVAYHSSLAGTNVGKTSILNGSTENVVYSGSMGSATLLHKRAMVSAGSGAWTTALVNALTARVGYSNDISPVPYWDALLLEYDVPVGW